MSGRRPSIAGVSLERAEASVLVIKPSSLGDIVHTLPAVARIRREQPAFQIAWVVNTEWTPLLAGLNGVSILPFPRRAMRNLNGILDFFAWARANLPKRPDFALDYQGLLRSAAMARICGARQVFGLQDAREGAGLFHHTRVAIPKGIHSVERYMALTSAFLGNPAVPTDLNIFPLPNGTCPAGFEADPGTFIVVHPCSRGGGKSLSAPAIQRIVASISPRTTVLVGRSDEPLPSSGAINLINATSLAELLWLLRHAQCILSVDSGPMHLAAALNDRVLGLHSWSDPRSVGPFNRRASIWQNGKIWPMDEVLDGSFEHRPGAMPEADAINGIAAWLCDAFEA